MKPNLEQTLISKIETAKAAVEVQLFNAWKKAPPDHREEIHAETRALTKLTFKLIKSIRGRIDG